MELVKEFVSASKAELGDSQKDASRSVESRPMSGQHEHPDIHIRGAQLYPFHKMWFRPSGQESSRPDEIGPGYVDVKPPERGVEDLTPLKFPSAQ